MNPDNYITIQKLPENILLDIFSYLPMRDRFIAERVCRKWHRIVSDKSLWKHVNLLFDKTFNLPKMWKDLSAHFSPYLLTLKIKGHTVQDGRWTQASMSDSMFMELASRCPNLWLLHLHYVNIYDLSLESLPPSIKSLSISETIWQPRWMKGKQQHLPKLEVLNLNVVYWVDNDDLDDIAYWKNLKTLCLDFFDLVTGPGMELIATNMKDLETLTLSNSYMEDSTIRLVTRNLKNLKKLSLCNTTGEISDSSLMLIVVELPKLIELDISYVDSLTVKALESLFKSKLKILKVIRKDRLTDDERNAIMKGFPHSICLIT